MPKNDFQMPTSLAQAADLLYSTREARLSVQKQVDELASRESAIKDFLIEQLPKGDASGVAGSYARVSLKTKTKAQVENWEDLYRHIEETGSWELVQRRISETAVRDRWEQGEEVPGVSKFHSIEVSCTKV